MKRKLKFEAWTGSEMLSDVVPMPSTNEILEVNMATADCRLQPVEAIRQFTGLLDKHGKEIYEGDIVEGRLSKMDELQKWTVEFSKGVAGYIVRGKRDKFDHLYAYKPLKVIGNIYENAEGEK